jgi:shikimate kinase
MKFVDLDALIEKHEGISPAKVYAEKGEKYFRDTERERLIEIVKSDNQVISTGGGAPCYLDNMEVMNKYGITIYLKMSNEAIIQRLSKLPPASKMRRLLIAKKSKEEIDHYVLKNMQFRQPYYEKARITVLNEGDDACIAVEEIVSSLQHLFPKA